MTLVKYSSIQTDIADRAARVLGRVTGNVTLGDPRFAVGSADERFIAMYAIYVGAQDFQRAPAANTNRLIYRLRNPGASGKVLVITKVVATCNVARQIRWGTISTTAADRATAVLQNPHASGNMSASVGVLTLDANSAADLSAAFSLDASILQALVPYAYTEPIRLAAGDAADFQVLDVASATTDRVDFRLEWYETS